ncbi:ATP-binding protein [uncultured Pseudodesulfovibrio sp.]|uniref:hybrid sensor histidine kinase/response regulator n=1 Tax=uncultured Pseudodesulfovibrio sp. TaxID=2035858 RepID=UPI0029C621C0|nr:ATP-binding protein [uncultured Pseudodesulfovibrio sp.]
MRILILAGKALDKEQVDRLFGDTEYEMVRYSSVSRGVRRLDKGLWNIVVLAPGPEDASWYRAITRIRKEYGLSVILLAEKGGAGVEEKALEAGAVDAFEFGCVTPKEFARTLRLLNRQVELERKSAGGHAMADWIEKTGRLGSWEMDSGGRTTWSDGFREILGDAEGLLSEEFTSIRQFVLPEDLEIYDAANRATFEQGWPLDFEYRIKGVDGRIRHLHLHRRVELDSGGNVKRAYGMVRDVSSEREFEEFLFRRDAIMQVIGSFAARFLRESDWRSGINSALRDFGKAMDVSRAYIVRKFTGSDGLAYMKMEYEWAASFIEPVIDLPEVQKQPFSPLYDRWKSTLLRRKVVAGHVRNFQGDAQKPFRSTGAKSLMIVPVFLDNEWWGFIGMSEHREERDWLPVEIESLTLMADIFGSCVLRRRMEDQLVEANRSAEEAKTMALEASKAKSRFLANMSHEIRTPIGGILGMAEMAITTGLTDEQREHMDMIRDAAGSLLSIVNDVLDISKIEADKMELRPRDFEFRPAIETSVRPFGPQADAKGVVFQHRVDSSVPVHLQGDPDRLGQILINLLGNALKFTERGLIDLNVEIKEEEAGRVCLLFTVRDTGEGIPKDKLDTIFDSFTQADSSVRKKHQGTGLGLSISRELVEMMGGQIGVESELGRGSVFSFTAWFDKSDTVVVQPAPAREVAPKALHLKILLAEDNPLNQKFLTHFLSMFGHTVIVAENGIEALDELKRRGREIDLVLMDIQMPEMGGMEATAAIRKSDGKRFPSDIPVIALTAYAMKGDRERILKEGFNDYVTKPVDMKKLSAAIARSVAGQDKGSAPVPAMRRVQEEQPAVEVPVKLDMEALVDRFEGNLTLLRDILSLFLIESDQKLEQLDAGLEGGDPTRIGAALHSITNMASHVLAMDIVNRSRHLEKMCYIGSLDEAMAGARELRPKFVALVNAVRERVKTL